MAQHPLGLTAGKNTTAGKLLTQLVDGPPITPGTVRHRLISTADPAWRFHRALRFAQSGEARVLVTGDEWVGRAARFLCDCQGYAEHGSLPTRSSDRALAKAYEIWVDPQARCVRPVLEALLLTDWTVEQVAEALVLPVDVVQAYAALFYDLAGWKHVSVVRNGLAWGRPSASGRHDVWHEIAMALGPEAVCNVWHSQPLGEALARQLDALAGSCLRRAAVVALVARPLTAENTRAFLQLYVELRRLERARQRNELAAEAPLSAERTTVPGKDDDRRWTLVERKLVQVKHRLIRSGCIRERRRPGFPTVWVVRYRERVGSRAVHRSVYLGGPTVARRAWDLIQGWRAALIPSPSEQRWRLFLLKAAARARGYSARACERVRAAVEASVSDPWRTLELFTSLGEGDASVAPHRRRGRPRKPNPIGVAVG